MELGIEWGAQAGLAPYVDQLMVSDSDVVQSSNCSPTDGKKLTIFKGDCEHWHSPTSPCISLKLRSGLAHRWVPSTEGCSPWKTKIDLMQNRTNNGSRKDCVLVPD